MNVDLAKKAAVAKYLKEKHLPNPEHPARKAQLKNDINDYVLNYFNLNFL